MAKKANIEEFRVDTTPRRVKKNTETLYNFPCVSEVTALITYLTDVLVKYGQDAQIEIIPNDDDDYWSSNSVEMKVTSFRDETPQEIEKRIAKAKRDAERAVVRRVEAKLKEEKKKQKEEAEELKLLQKLQKKYKGYNIENVT